MCRDAAENTYYCPHNRCNTYGTFSGIEDGSRYAGFQYKDGQTWAILAIWSTENGRAGIEHAPPSSMRELFGGEGTCMCWCLMRGRQDDGTPCACRLGRKARHPTSCR